MTEKEKCRETERHTHTHRQGQRCRERAELSEIGKKTQFSPQGDDDDDDDEKRHDFSKADPLFLFEVLIQSG